MDASRHPNRVPTRRAQALHAVLALAALAAAGPARGKALITWTTANGTTARAIGFGESAAGAGDMTADGDSFADLIVGAG